MTFRDIRVRAGFTQATLAAAADLEQTMISAIERGKVSSVRYPTMIALAKALKVPAPLLADVIASRHREASA
jgi:transcriptional regulator with XRE-family HTH domain